ncbi:MAG: DsbA family protein [Lysobacterales bacterium]|jgi:protein-disulfide isomerase|nr:MAG: DsbA family protein [Xanthomonadales bacterium]
MRLDTRHSLTAALVMAVLLGSAVARASSEPDGSAAEATVQTAVAPQAAAGTTAVQFNVLGRADAPVTIIEFTDLQCPYCARHAVQTFPELRRRYIETGKVRYTSRDMPLPFHAFAAPAAVANRCAGEQGRFWEFREAVFAAQSELGQAPYARIAAELGLDGERFEACRGDPRQAAAVRADLELARRHGITSTPSFVIGRLVDGEFVGEMISGAKPYAEFAARIEALLPPAP